jgi:molecular chaperone GrpE
MDAARKQEILAAVASWLDAAPDDEPLPAGLDQALAESTAAPADLAAIVAAVTACGRELQIQSKSLKRLEGQLAAAGEPSAREQQLLLDVCDLHDRLSRCVASGTKACGEAPWLARRLGGAGIARAIVAGVALVAERAADLLAREGITPLPAVGMPFDPRTMRALEAVLAPGSAAKDTVVECARTGYLRDDAVLRVAEVKVAR